MTGRILIADSVSAERIVLKARLASQAYDIVQAGSADEVLDIVRASPPDLILLPRRLGTSDSVDLFHAVQEVTGPRAVPVILRVARADFQSRLAALEAGVDAVIDVTADPALLCARIRNLLRRHANEADLRGVATSNTAGFAEPMAGFKPASNIALVAPPSCDGAALGATLADHMRDRIRVLPEQNALADISRGAPPDAIVVIENPRSPNRAMQLISELHSRSHTMRAALILVQDRPAAHRGVTALDIGLSDLVDTGFNAQDIALRLRRELARKGREDRMRAAVKDGLRLAATDPLTGLFNRRYAMSRLKSLDAEARAAGTHYAVMLIDLDRFKSINDRYGHAAGDAVLVEVATRMRNGLRKGDLLARIGGEEFLAAVGDCDLAIATRTANRIRRAIGSRPILLPGGIGPVAVTASIGVMLSSSRNPLDCERLLGHADRALYGAKADGRNQVTVGHHAA